MNEPCPHCQGTGRVRTVEDGRLTDPQTCWLCRGEGEVDPEQIPNGYAT